MLVQEACEDLADVPKMAYKHKWERFPASFTPFHLLSQSDLCFAELTFWLKHP